MHSMIFDLASWPPTDGERGQEWSDALHHLPWLDLDLPPSVTGEGWSRIPTHLHPALPTHHPPTQRPSLMGESLSRWFINLFLFKESFCQNMISFNIHQFPPVALQLVSLKVFSDNTAVCKQTMQIINWYIYCVWKGDAMQKVFEITRQNNCLTVKELASTLLNIAPPPSWHQLIDGFAVTSLLSKGLNINTVQLHRS